MKKEKRENNHTKIKGKAWVVSVLMGLGHFRAAYPLKNIAYKGIIVYGSKKNTPRREYRLWKKIRRIYYILSKASRIPIIGKYLVTPLLVAQKIDPYYPIKDASKPNLAVKYLTYLIKRKRFCYGLIKKIREKPLPVINTFYATAIAIDKCPGHSPENYLLICDADFHRVWVPDKPKQSKIKYLAPCENVKKRLLTYGVPEQNINLTGFPLPPKNIGSEKKLEILKKDLYKRLLRLDPKNKFFSFHKKSVLHHLKEKSIPEKREDFFTLTFAIGGAGAQLDMVEEILKSLKTKIKQNKIKIKLSAGIKKEVFEKILSFINTLGLYSYMDEYISILYDNNPYDYVEKFNKALRETDILWTKPSELTFYCALGIPILIAPPIGTHEECNQRWLQRIHAGIIPTAPIEYTHQWLFDLRENGTLAESAWDGFLKAPKLGAFKIMKLIEKDYFG